jgi:Ca2+-binding RTX toxin-like protein
MSSGSLGQSYAYLNSYSYSALRGALSGDATSRLDSSFLASLPSSAPVSGTFWATSAQAKALGLSPATGSRTDGFIGFSSSHPFTYDDSGGVPSGSYDFNGVALHEMTEVMGRLMLGGATIGRTSNSYDIVDLMHYSSSGVQVFSAGTLGYSSADGGQTSLGQFNTGGGDGADWAHSVTGDAFDAISASGVINAFSVKDVSEMDALGWNAIASTPASAPAASISFSANGLSGVAAATPYSGPVAALTSQYIWPSAEGVAISTGAPNVFLKGGPSDDALQVTSGSNVLDGGAGSNFLVGASGADGGTDTFFLDGRGSGVTWSTIVDFHPGDELTVWGFVPSQSSQQWVDSDGVAGYQGLTLHSELGGAGTGLNASATLAGLSMSDFQKLSITTGIVGGNDYMLIQYTG